MTHFIQTTLVLIIFFANLHVLVTQKNSQSGWYMTHPKEAEKNHWFLKKDLLSECFSSDYLLADQIDEIIVNILNYSNEASADLIDYKSEQ